MTLSLFPHYVAMALVVLLMLVVLRWMVRRGSFKRGAAPYFAIQEVGFDKFMTILHVVVTNQLVMDKLPTAARIPLSTRPRKRAGPRTLMPCLPNLAAEGLR